MQRRQPIARHGTVPRKTARDQALGDLDDSGTARLVRLRRAAVEPVPKLDARARRRVDRGNVRAEQSAYGSNSVALGVGLVPDGPTRVAFRDSRGVEREPCACNATRMGATVRILLDVLAGVDDLDGDHFVAVWFVPVEYLARRG